MSERMNSWYGIKGLSRNLFGSLLFALFIYTPAAHSEQFIAKNGEIRGTVYGQETVSYTHLTLPTIYSV